MFKIYENKIISLLSEKKPGTDWKNILNYHQKMISRIQHERLIHLLVTVFVGIVMSTASFIVIITQNSSLLVFTVPLFILFIAYLIHYRFLENTTQKWYQLEDKIMSRL